MPSDAGPRIARHSGPLLHAVSHHGPLPVDTKLVPLAPGILAWASLTADQKKVYARMMEVCAGFLEQTDHNAGRVIEAIEAAGELDNTLILYIVGDHGASAEGSPQGLLNEMTFFNGVKEDLATVLARVDDIGSWQTYNHHPIGWAHAMCTPFSWTKQIASHYGGTRNGLVVSWPKGIADAGGVRAQWHHAIDIVPTIYEACGVTPPEVVNGVGQKPIDGVSMAYSFADARAPSRRTTQYFERIGNRAIYHDGWVACTNPPVPPWNPAAAEVDAIDGPWELYHTDVDFSQAENLAASHPEKLRELKLLFYTEAARHDVLPIDNSKTARLDPALRFACDGGGIGKGGKATLEVDGKPVAEGRIEQTIPIRVTLDEGLDVGEDTGTPVTTSYDIYFGLQGRSIAL